jgi:hypothetical protein
MIISNLLDCLGRALSFLLRVEIFNSQRLIRRDMIFGCRCVLYLSGEAVLMIGIIVPAPEGWGRYRFFDFKSRFTIPNVGQPR